MSDTGLFTLIFTGVWCTVGIAFLGIGFFLRSRGVQNRERLRARAEATVVDFIDHFGTYHNHPTHSRNPVVEFDYEGRTISVECMEGLGPRSFYEGQRVELLYDPDDPSFVRMAGFQPEAKLGTVFVVIGTASIVLGITAAAIINMIGLSA